MSAVIDSPIRQQADEAGEEQARALAAAWGWSVPPPDVLAQARLSIEMHGLRSGEVVVRLGLCSQEQVEQLLISKPQSTPTIEWLAQSLPAVREQSQRILALREGLQFMETLDVGMRVHPALSSGEGARARTKCDQMNAVLVLVEEVQPVLVFSDLYNLIRYRQMGREERLLDPMRQVIGGNGRVLLLALAPRQSVITLARSVASVESASGAGAPENVWVSHQGRQKSAALRQMAQIMDAAIDRQVTDISIFPNRDGSGDVWLRRYGDLQRDGLGNLAHFVPAQMEECARFLLSLSGANPEGARLRESRNGQFIYRSATGEAFVRASFIPADRAGLDIDMTSVSLRLLPRTPGGIEVEDLRFTQQVIDEVSKVILYSQGLVVLAGPTNSGKSTTIAGLIGLHTRAFGDRKKRLSIEDPVERYLPRMIQVSLPEGSQATYGSTFRDVLRHDPDVIFIGEVRDEQSANAAMRAASSGHLVFTTVHASDALTAFERLANLVPERERRSLVESVSMIIGQRLVPMLCPHCVCWREATTGETELFAYYCKLRAINKIAAPRKVPDVDREKVEHCGHCHDGVAGLIPIHEVLPVSKQVRRMFLESGQHLADEIMEHCSVRLFDMAFELLRDGRIALNSVFV